MSTSEMDPTTRRLLGSTDASVWAEEFCKAFVVAKRQNEPPAVIDDSEGLMIGWFANAIMQGFDWARAKYEPTFFDDVKAFHRAFDLPVGQVPRFTSQPIDERVLRMRLVFEEVQELAEAHIECDIYKIADAIADAIYVLCGMAVAYGIPLNEVWNEVQRSNMDKVCKECNKPHYREDGKVAKPEGWTPPNIEAIIDEAYHA